MIVQNHSGYASTHLPSSAGILPDADCDKEDVTFPSPSALSDEHAHERKDRNEMNVLYNYCRVAV